MRAAGQGSAEAVSWLLDQGADWRVTDPRGRPALEIAMNHAQDVVVEALQRWGTTHTSQVVQGEQPRSTDEERTTVRTEPADAGVGTVQGAERAPLVPTAEWVLKKQQQDENEVECTGPAKATTSTRKLVLQIQQADEALLQTEHSDNEVDLEAMYDDLLAGYDPDS